MKEYQAVNLGGIVSWLNAICLAWAGGVIVSVVAFCGDVLAWQQARRAAHLSRRTARSRRTAKLPTLREYVDPWPDFVALLTRIALGVIAGAVFRSQVTTPLAAFAIGASAPALLTQLGNARMVKPAEDGTGSAAAASIRLVEPEMPKSEGG